MFYQVKTFVNSLNEGGLNYVGFHGIELELVGLFGCGLNADCCFVLQNPLLPFSAVEASARQFALDHSQTTRLILIEDGYFPHSDTQFL